MGLDNIEFREIATKMFFQENQYKLARKTKNGKRDAGGRGGGVFIEHNLVKIT